MRRYGVSNRCGNLRLMTSVPLRHLTFACVVLQASASSIHCNLCLETLDAFGLLQNKADIPIARVRAL
jgi:hypothetical protein